MRKHFFEKYFWWDIFDENIFGENIFGNNIFLERDLTFPPTSHYLPRTLYIQLPPPLTSYLKLRGGRTNEVTDWTEHTMIVPFIVLDLSLLVNSECC